MYSPITIYCRICYVTKGALSISINLSHLIKIIKCNQNVHLPVNFSLNSSFIFFVGMVFNQTYIVVLLSILIRYFISSINFEKLIWFQF